MPILLVLLSLLYGCCSLIPILGSPNKEIEVLKRQKEFLQKEIVKDRDIIREINTAEGREKFGRENYYFKKENEDIFIIEYDTIK